MKEDYIIKPHENAQPHVIYVACIVPMPLLEKVQAELTRIENLGVILQVDEPTQLSIGMIVASKNNGSVLI